VYLLLLLFEIVITHFDLIFGKIKI